MKKKKIIKIIAAYLYLKELLDGVNEYELFKRIYIDNEDIGYIEITYDYYITNPARWKRKIKKYMEILSQCNKCDLVYMKHKKRKKANK